MVKNKKVNQNIYVIIGILTIVIFSILFNLGNIRSADDIPRYGSGETKTIFVIGFPFEYLKVSHKDCHIPIGIDVPDGFECGSKPNINILQLVINVVVGIIISGLIILFCFKTKINILMKIISIPLIFTILETLAILI
jgi:hypothetical protein